MNRLRILAILPLLACAPERPSDSDPIDAGPTLDGGATCTGAACAELRLDPGSLFVGTGGGVSSDATHRLIHITGAPGGVLKGPENTAYTGPVPALAP